MSDIRNRTYRPDQVELFIQFAKKLFGLTEDQERDLRLKYTKPASEKAQ